jgi:hypothetical protein
MSKGFGGISVTPMQDKFQLSDEEKKKLEHMNDNQDIWFMENEVQRINRDEKILNDFYLAWGDRRLCEILALIRKRRDDIEKDEKYKAYQLAKKSSMGL